MLINYNMSTLIKLSQLNDALLLNDIKVTIIKQL